MPDDYDMLKEENIDIESIQTFLPKVDAFKNLDSSVIAAMASRMSLLKFEAGEHLIWAGGLGQYLLIIKEGSIYVSLDSKDIELGSGAIVGEMALLSRKPSKADVVALKDSEAFAVDFADFKELMKSHEGLALAITELMKSRMFGDDGLNSLGHYKIAKQFEDSSAPDIYEAIDIHSGREVIIKMLNYDKSSQAGFDEQFKSEVGVLKNLNHPNMLKVIETIEDYSTEFVVMENIKGQDLEMIMEEKGEFNAKQTSGVISKVALALEFASHEDNGCMAHSNIRLSNILLDSLGHVKLMGFGLSGCDTDEKSLPYLAPEITQDKPIDFRADIYALGVVAFYMLSGQMPYASTTREALIYEQNGSLSPDINSLVADLPEGLAEFINRALNNNPDDRVSNWFEIQTLLVSGKGSSLNLLANDKMDMALVIQLQTLDINTSALKQQLHQVMNTYKAQYEMEVVTRENANVDFAR